MIVKVYLKASMYPPSRRDINDYDVTLTDEKGKPIETLSLKSAIIRISADPIDADRVVREVDKNIRDRNLSVIPAITSYLQSKFEEQNLRRVNPMIDNNQYGGMSTSPSDMANMYGMVQIPPLHYPMRPYTYGVDPITPSESFSQRDKDIYYLLTS